MSDARRLTNVVGLILTFVLLATVTLTSGCSGEDSEGGGKRDSSSEEPAPAKDDPAEEEPKYTSWQVYINDDDSYQQGSVTYSIALNLTATNPTGDMAGTYTGSATARTTSEGDVGGAQLNASAIAKSSRLEFTIEDPTAGGALAPLDGEEPVYAGTGTISMEAAGSGSVGPAGGSFGNSSSQRITVRVQGDAVTLTVPISGHTYTFEGTISGK